MDEKDEKEDEKECEKDEQEDEEDDGNKKEDKKDEKDGEETAPRVAWIIANKGRPTQSHQFHSSLHLDLLIFQENHDHEQSLPEEDEDAHCTSDKSIIEKLMENYKSFRTPSETGVIVWIEVGSSSSLHFSFQFSSRSGSKKSIPSTRSLRTLIWIST